MKKNWFSAERTIHSNIRTFCCCCCCWYPAIKIGRNDFKIRLIITKKRSRKKNDPKIRFQVDDDEMIHIQLIMIILICHMMMMMDKHGIWIIEKDSIRESLICLTCLKYLTDDAVILFWLIMIKVLLFMAATTNQHSNQMMNEWTVLVENVKKNLENSKDDRWGVPNFLNLTTNTTIKHEHHHHH